MSSEPKKRERDQINTYFSVVEMQLDGFVGSPFKIDDKGHLDLAGCMMAAHTLRNLRDYTVQAVKHASHLGFLARAGLESVVEQCDRTIAALKNLETESHKLDGSPDHETVKRAIVNLHNRMRIPDL